MNAYQEIYEQYCVEASMLWVLRSIAVDQPHYSVKDVFNLETRIQSHLDGLMGSIDTAWYICLKELEQEEAGEVFTSAVIAFRSHDINKIHKVVEVGLTDDETFKGLVSALGWLPDKLVHPWIKKFLTSKDLNHKYLAISACSIRRENPEEFLIQILKREDCKAHIPLYRRSLRLIGELRRLDSMPFLEEALNSDDDGIRFWAIWSSILLGKRDLVKALASYVFNPGVFQSEALNIAFRVLPIDQARGWISTLAKSEGQSRIVVKATGILGDPHAVNWLIGKMQDDSLAKLAGEAFCLITGIDLEAYQLLKESSKEPVSDDNEELDDELVELDEDENLQLPDYEKVKKIWMIHGKNFIAGQRYVLGKPVSVSWLNNKINTVTQRQRQAVAMELALLGDSPLINTHAKQLSE